MGFLINIVFSYVVMIQYFYQKGLFTIVIIYDLSILRANLKPSQTLVNLKCLEILWQVPFNLMTAEKIELFKRGSFLFCNKVLYIIRGATT